MIILYIVFTLIGVSSIGVYIGFSTTEGKDERGSAILAKAAQIAFVFIFLGFAFHLLYFEFSNPSVEHIRATMTVWMSLVFASYALGILIYRRNM
ncbi:MAG: hypothetical protein LOD88_08350 [Novibacillus thermophilus]|jgi:hypothetical protein